MSATLGLLVILAFIVAMALVNFVGKKDADRRSPPPNVPGRPDRSSDRDMIESID